MGTTPTWRSRWPSKSVISFVLRNTRSTFSNVLLTRAEKHNLKMQHYASLLLHRMHNQDAILGTIFMTAFIIHVNTHKIYDA